MRPMASSVSGRENLLACISHAPPKTSSPCLHVGLYTPEKWIGFAWCVTSSAVPRNMQKVVHRKQSTPLGLYLKNKAIIPHALSVLAPNIIYHIRILYDRRCATAPLRQNSLSFSLCLLLYISLSAGAGVDTTLGVGSRLSSPREYSKIMCPQ